MRKSNKDDVEKMALHREYIAAVKEKNTKLALKLRNTLIVRHMPLVHKLVARYGRGMNYVDPADLLQAAALGLLRAIELFDPDRAKFSTYAGFWIRDAIQTCAIREQTVHRPDNAKMPVESMMKFYRFMTEKGRKPEPEEIGVTREQIDFLETPFKILGIHCERGHASRHRTATIHEDELPGYEPEIEDLYDVQAQLHQIRKTLSEFEPLEQRVIEALFIEGALIEDVSKRENIGRTRVTEIRTQVMKELQELFA